MKLSDCNKLFKKLLFFVLLSAQGINPLYPAATKHADNLEATDNTSKQSQLSDEEYQRALEAQLMQEIPRFMIESILHPLFSKIDTLKLMVSNPKSKLSLTLDQKKAFLTALGSINGVLEKHAQLFMCSNKKDVMGALALSRKLTAYLTDAAKKDLKNVSAFSFSHEPSHDEPTLETIAQELQNALLDLEKLDENLQNLGITWKDKLKNKIAAANKKYNLSAIGMTLGIIAFILCSIRYNTKPYRSSNSPEPQPRRQHKDRVVPVDPDDDTVYRTLAEDEVRPEVPAPDPDSQPTGTPQPAPQPAPQSGPAPSSFERFTTGFRNIPDYTRRGFNAFINSSFIRFIDDRIIGQEEREAREFDIDPITQRPRYVKVRVPGTGVFGKVQYFSKAFFAVAGFATAMKLLSEKFNNDVHSWKGLQKDPAGFFNIKGLLKNEKQSISPIEELFLLNALVRIEPKITFKDITGLSAQKKELMAVINYLLNPELFEKTGTGVETGYLFHGPTGTGKTQLAEALAGELILKYKKPLAFFKIRGSELRYVGIKKVFDTVRKYAPCICFIDEIDLLNLQRDQNTSLLDEFLTSMKTDDNSHRVIILGATNRIDHIDHALLRPGRFGKIIIFENPTLDERKEFFKNDLLGKNIYDPFLDIDKLGQETENCSYADLASIVNDAVAQSTQRQQKLSYAHFDSAIDNFKRRIGDVEDIPLPAEERLLIATHLAGHALGFALLGTSETLHKVTMLPIQKRVAEEKVWLSDLTTAKKITYYGDVFTLHKTNTAGFDTPEQKINMVRVLLAGHIAEKILLGSTSYSYHSEDNTKARNILESLALKGTKKEQHSKQEYAKILDEVSELFNKYEAETTEFIMQNKDMLIKLRQSLLDRTTLTNEDVQKLIQEHSQPLAAPAA